MKKIFILLVSVSLILMSCSKNPMADFSVSDTTVGIGDYVTFTNRSIDAENFEWDFGDGFVSNSFNASHYYDYDGTFTISLKAFNNGRTDVVYKTVNVIGASIEITVEEYYTPFYLVPDISVILYASAHEWDLKNTSLKVAEDFTSASGVVVFDHLAHQRYYVDVWGPHHDNYQLETDDPGFVETPVLIPGTLTTWKAFVDYYPAGKKSTLDRFEAQARRNTETSEHAPRAVGDRK